MRLVGLVAPLLLLSSCFAPAVPECAFRCGTGAASCPPGEVCGGDGYCHAPGDTVQCGPTPPDARRPDAALADATPLPVDAPFVPPDARVDAPLAVDAPAMPPDGAGKPDAPAGTPDAPAGTPDAPAGTPDAGCGVVCEDPRTCGPVSGCECGGCFADDWCGDLCLFAVCGDSGRCCLPDSTPCTATSQCCDGLVCIVFCL